MLDFYGEGLLATHLIWRITPCRLSVTASSIYSQLPFMSGGRLIHTTTSGHAIP